jgi:hypothetical protein
MIGQHYPLKAMQTRWMMYCKVTFSESAASRDRTTLSGVYVHRVSHAHTALYHDCALLAGLFFLPYCRSILQRSRIYIYTWAGWPCHPTSIPYSLAPFPF